MKRERELRERELREIMEQAIEEMGEVLSQETEEDGAEQWDPDAWEEEVVRFTRRLGQRMVQTWGEVKSKQAKAQAPFAPVAGEDAHLHRWRSLWWLSVFGRIEVPGAVPALPPGLHQPPALSGVDRVEMPKQVFSLAAGIDRFWCGEIIRAGQQAT